MVMTCLKDTWLERETSEVFVNHGNNACAAEASKVCAGLFVVVGR